MHHFWLMVSASKSRFRIFTLSSGTAHGLYDSYTSSPQWNADSVLPYATGHVLCCRKSHCSHQIIVLVLAVFLVFEGEPHPENPVLGSGIMVICYINILVGNLLAILRHKVEPEGSCLHHIADWFRLDKVQRGDQVHDLLNKADQHNLNSLGLYVVFLLLYFFDIYIEDIF